MPKVVSDPALRGMENVLAQSTDLQPANVSVDEVLDSLENDPEFMIQFFLGDQLTQDVPQFHIDIMNRMTSMSVMRLLLCIPRGHAKTTWAKLAVIWHWLFTDHRFAVYLSNTAPIAKNCCRDIINFLKCDNFISVFGPAEFQKEAENEGLWIFVLNLPNGKKKKCILRAAGAGQQTRGINVDNQRPDIAIVDDLEDKENTKTEVLQKQLDDWMFGTFIKSLDKFKYKIIWLGNMLRKTSLLARLSKNPIWHPIVYGCLIKNPVTGIMQPLWPELWPIKEIREDFAEYTALGLVETWMCEMMNMPGSGKNGFTGDQIKYELRPSPDSNQILATFVTIDPAFGEKQVNDNSAVVVHAILDDGPTMVVDYACEKMSEAQMFDKALDFAETWGAWFWGIESVAAQAVLITLFKVYAIQQSVDSSLEMVKLMAGQHKSGRIQAWVSMMSKGATAIPEGEMMITSQLLAYDPEQRDNNDDLIDACAYQPQMLDNYMPLIIQNYMMNLNDNHAIGQETQTGVDACRI